MHKLLWYKVLEERNYGSADIFILNTTDFISTIKTFIKENLIAIDVKHFRSNLISSMCIYIYIYMPTQCKRQWEKERDNEWGREKEDKRK